MKRYQLLGATLLLTVALCLTACGGSSTKSESDISADIQATDSYFSTYGLTVDSIEITKRQTNDADKTDYVWVSIEASNDDFRYNANYSLTYVLYNDGWMLEDFWIEDESYLALHPETVTQERAEGDIASWGYSDIQFVNRTEYDNEVCLTYTASKTEYYLKTVYDISAVYEFSPDCSWDWCYPTETIREQIPDVVGEWRYTHYRDNGELMEDYYVNITDVDMVNNSISLEYSFIGYTIYHRSSFLNNKDVNFNSNGVITVPLVYDDASYLYGNNVCTSPLNSQNPPISKAMKIPLNSDCSWAVLTLTVELP